MFERLQHSIVKSTFLHALPYMEFLIFEWTIHFLHALSYMIVFECARPLVRARRRWDVRPYEDRYFLVSIIISSSAHGVLTHAFHWPWTTRKMSCRVTHKHGYRLSMCWKSLSTFSNGRSKSTSTHLSIYPYRVTRTGIARFMTQAISR